MAKDPAFLFYSQDWFVGTQTMTFEDRGKFITILCMMHQQGRFDEETIRLLVGSISVKLKSKFEVDENGLWYNVKLEKEIEKRRQFTESRRVNGSLGGRPKSEEKPSALPSAKPEGKPTNNLVENEDILFIYSLYPNKCTKKNVSTGKGKKNKEQIKTLLKTTTKDVLAKTITWYIEEQKRADRFIMNFKTFLNNLPELPTENPIEVKRDDIIRFRWEKEPTHIIRDIEKSKSNEYFKNMKEGGYIPVII